MTVGELKEWLAAKALKCGVFGSEAEAMHLCRGIACIFMEQQGFATKEFDNRQLLTDATELNEKALEIFKKIEKDLEHCWPI